MMFEFLARRGLWRPACSTSGSKVGIDSSWGTRAELHEQVGIGLEAVVKERFPLLCPVDSACRAKSCEFRPLSWPAAWGTRLRAAGSGSSQADGPPSNGAVRFSSTSSITGIGQGVV